MIQVEGVTTSNVRLGMSCTLAERGQSGCNRIDAPTKRYSTGCTNSLPGEHRLTFPPWKGEIHEKEPQNLTVTGPRVPMALEHKSYPEQLSMCANLDKSVCCWYDVGQTF